MTRPSRVGRFRLGSVLGAGGMAIVYRGEDTRGGRPVAIKLLADNLAAEGELRTRFLREANIAKQLDHPNVVEVLAAGEREGRPYIVMELVEGSPLAAVLAREGRLDEERAVDVTLQVSAALAHAHDLGIVHRDVKPGNVLVARDGRVKLADFGIARGLGEEATTLTSVGSVLGTVAYLSPEQARGDMVGTATDIWSLGVVVAEMTSGTQPGSYPALQALVAEGRASAVPGRLAEVVARCLEHDPSLRPSADEVASIVLGSHEPTVARTRVLPPPVESTTEVVLTPESPEPSPSSPRRPRPRPRRVGLGVAAAAVVAVLVLVVVAVGADRQQGETAPPAPRVRQEPPRAQAQDLAAWLRTHAQG